MGYNLSVEQINIYDDISKDLVGTITISEDGACCVVAVDALFTPQSWLEFASEVHSAIMKIQPE